MQPVAVEESSVRNKIKLRKLKIAIASIIVRNKRIARLNCVDSYNYYFTKFL